MVFIHDGMDSEAGLLGRLANLGRLLGARDGPHLDRLEADLPANREPLGIGTLFGQHRISVDFRRVVSGR